MRYLKWALLGVVACALVVVALANPTPVTLRWLPDIFAKALGLPNLVIVPLYLVIFGGIVAGFVIGYLIEWVREHKTRVEASRAKRDAVQLEREVQKLRAQDTSAQDDVLALLEASEK